MDYDYDTVHDFLTEGKWRFFFAGYSHFEEKRLAYYTYVIYRVLIVVTCIYTIAMTVVGFVLSQNNMAEAVQCLHVTFIVITLFSSIMARLSRHYSPLYWTMEQLKKGVFLYNEDCLDEDYARIKKKNVLELRLTTKYFGIALSSIGFSNMIFFPIFNYLRIDEDTSDRLFNPYLPNLPMYVPFNTRNFLGYTGAYMIYTILVTFTIPIMVCMDFIYCSCTIQLKAQFEILNHSLLNLEKRAYYIFRKRQKSQDNKTLSEQIYYSGEFRDCIESCFMTNIKHHQSLLKLKSSFDNMLGDTFLLVVALGSVVLAQNAILLLEASGRYFTIAHTIGTLACELFYILHYCWYGEQIIQVSTQCQYCFYSTPWYNCGRRLKQVLSIVISNTRKPLAIKTIVFDVAASMDIFGTIISTMYQVMNLLRNT